MSVNEAEDGNLGENSPGGLTDLAQMVGVELKMHDSSLSYRDGPEAWVQICEGADVTASMELYLLNRLRGDLIDETPNGVVDMSTLLTGKDMVDFPLSTPRGITTFHRMNVFFDAMESLEDGEKRSVCCIVRGRRRGRRALQERWIQEINAAYGPGIAVAGWNGDVLYNMPPALVFLAKMRVAIDRCKQEGTISPAAVAKFTRGSSAASSEGGGGYKERNGEGRVGGVPRTENGSRGDGDSELSTFQELVRVENRLILQVIDTRQCSDRFVKERYPGLRIEMAASARRFTAEDRRRILPLLNGSWLEVARKFENYCRDTVGMSCSGFKLFEIFVIHLRGLQGLLACDRSGIWDQMVHHVRAMSATPANAGARGCAACGHIRDQVRMGGSNAGRAGSSRAPRFAVDKRK